ncbi:helix-turn-helix domain-containing protein [Larkinella terrae]|uniref:Helix-turn-helix domain-containing protein n=1 Tax=Larkinella terrae TaxID=2025311 RepID=A0A7K0ESD0_9BACT|nr:AraC family transcriptional regulator [Larkinella terrae]MRS64723.1 helix-turn-helix domain-containing protein [Larkinella terrae]
MKHFKTLSELHQFNGYPPPEHPMVSLLRCTQKCSFGSSEFTGDFYMIGLKKMKAGFIRYGRTKYDGDSGSMYFIKPRQVAEMRNLELEEDGFAIYIHEDYLSGHPLHSEIRKYPYFEYEANEALHLSPKEEQIIWALYRSIETEYNNNPDEYSKEIILGHVEGILRYSQRFYKRQFVNRSGLSGRIISRFTESLTKYVENGQLAKTGLPTVKFMAAELNLSASYLSDLLKQETGKTALEHIHIFLISEAKHLLNGPDTTVAEIAYSLGFDNPPYFSRLFKKEVGVSPNQYKKFSLN